MTAPDSVLTQADPTMPDQFVEFWSAADKRTLWAFVVFIGENRKDYRLDFLLSLDEFSGTVSASVRRALAQAIYTEFVAPRARRPVGVSSVAARELEDVIGKGGEMPAGLFGGARQHVVGLLQTDYEVFRTRR